MNPYSPSGFDSPRGSFHTRFRTDDPRTPVKTPHPGLVHEMRTPDSLASTDSSEALRCKRRSDHEVMVKRTRPSPGLQVRAEPTPSLLSPPTQFNELVRQRNQLMAEAHELTRTPSFAMDRKTLDASLTTLRSLAERLAGLDSDIHQALDSNEPEMATTIRNVLRLSMSDLMEAIRLRDIARLEFRLSGLGVEFDPDVPGQLLAHNGIAPLPVELLVQLATLHADDAAAASAVIAARLLTGAARHTPLPLEPATWLSLKHGLELLAGSLLGRLTAEDRQALLGTGHRGHCLGHVQLQHALLNPDHTSEECLQQVLLMPGSRMIVMIRLLALPAPWTPEACQLAAACASAVGTGVQLMPDSMVDTHVKLLTRLDQVRAARRQAPRSDPAMTTAESASALAARGLFDLFPVTAPMHRARDVAQRWALEIQQHPT